MDIWHCYEDEYNPDVWYEVNLAWHFGTPTVPSRTHEDAICGPTGERRRKKAVELRPHQEKAVNEMHNGCVLCGGTGVGKTITALYYYFTKVCGGVVGDFGSMRTPRDIYVITTAQKRDLFDWQKEAAKLGIINDDPEDSVSGIKMTVDSWNNIGKYTEVEDAFFIFDEQRLVGSGEWAKAHITIARSNQWILLSATPGDTWLDYITVFVANGFYKNRTAFKREHVVYSAFTKFPKVERYVGVGKLVRYRNKVLVDMPYERHTIRHTTDLTVQYDKELFDKVVKKRWHVYEDRPLRDVAELFAVMRKVANSDPSRLSAVRGLLTRHPKLIVFYNFDYELEILRTLTSPISNTSGQTITSKPASSSTLESRRTRSSSSTRKSSSTSSLDGSTFSSPTGNDTTSSSTSPKLSDLEMANLLAGLPLETPAEQSNSKDRKATSNSMRSRETNSSGVLQTGDQAIFSGLSGGATGPDGTSFAVAEWNGHKHEPIPDTDSWVYLVQYQAGSEGWNCIETNATVFYSLPYSYKNFHQAHGRIDRLNTPFTDLYYYILKSYSEIDLAVARSLNSKRNFNEREFTKGQWAVA